VTRVLLMLALGATGLPAADKWVKLRSGPFEVLGQTGERPARERLFEAEQFRYTLGELLGKNDLSSVWPIRIILVKDKQRAVPGGIAMGRDSWIGTTGGEDWKRACARILIDGNTNRLPSEIESGLIALVSTLEIKGTKLALGSPPAGRTRDWARVRLLATAPDYRGRMRVFVSNLEQGAGYDVAYRNAFQKRAPEIEKEVDAFLASGSFESVPVPGRALSEKDFTVREATAHEGAVALADVAAADPSRAAEAEAAYRAAGGVEGQEGLKQFDAAARAGSTNPRAWLALGTREGFLKAAELNPRWAEPHVRLAALEQDPGRKATELQKAANLEPRNGAIWKAFALALVDARQYAMATKAFGGAERAAATEQEREAIRKERLDIEARRADFDEAERKRRLEAEKRELERVKNAALMEIRQAESKTNERLRAEHGEKPEEVLKMEDLDKLNRLEGQLERVDCLAKGQSRLNVRAAGGKLSQFVIVNPAGVAIAGGGSKPLACGPQNPPRKLIIEYRTARDVQSIEFK
jgi:hypothetical protein